MPPKKKAAEESAVAVVENEVDNEVIAFNKVSHAKRQDMVVSTGNLAEIRELFGTTVDWEDIEPSFTVAPKDLFEEVPLIIAGFRINQSKKYMMRNPDDPEGKAVIPAEFVSMLVAKYDPKTEQLLPIEELTHPATGEAPTWVIVNDGSTGIRDQLTRYSEKFDYETTRIPPIIANKGFRKSEYDFDDGNGNVGRATTWYIG